MEYYVFVLHKESKYIEEVVSYLVAQQHKMPSNDFMEDRGILSASMSSEDATVLKLKFPFINIMSIGQVNDMIGQLDLSLKRRMTEVKESTDDCEDYTEEFYDDPYDEKWGE